MQNPDSVAKLVFERLESNVRSSSPIESINSQIRDYLNSSRGQVTQETLNMIAYFLNHKVASRGCYKGTSARERLTGEPEKETVIDQIVRHSALRQERSDLSGKTELNTERMLVYPGSTLLPYSRRKQVA